ncbi:HAMP domain-containing protein, partial [bacterium]|nr:HAMP domain-containing protein [bacterium]
KADLFYKTVRVERNKKLVGQVHFVFTNQKVIDLVKQHSVTTLVLTFIIIIILGVTVYAIGNSFLRKPVDELKETAIDLAQGNLDREIDTSRIDELGVLARSFSVMRDSIRTQMSELRYFNEHLEVLVDQRTEELSEALEDIKDAKRIAEEANEAKSDFLANMSHELRTPMHAILGFTKLGIGKIDSLSRQKLKDYFQEILNSGERLLNLLNVLLDLSKLEAGKENYQFEDGSLSEAVKSVINELDALTNGMKMEIVFQEPDSDDLVSMDREKIMQVIRNLLSNAIKFSDQGKKITIDIVSQSNDVILSVKDTGIGIPEDELQAIFDKFIQSSRTNTGAGGTGLGLAISKKIINKHQGEIWAENNPSGGSTFLIRLPHAATQDV